MTAGEDGGPTPIEDALGTSVSHPPCGSINKYRNEMALSTGETGAISSRVSMGDSPTRKGDGPKTHPPPDRIDE